jgi:serine/threonine protein kinase
LVYKNGDLGNVIENCRVNKEHIPNHKILKWSIGILDGLDFIHSKGLLHSNLKPANVLLDEIGRVKLTDLATVTKCHQPQSRGAPVYASPEAARQEPIDYKSDVW